MKKNLLQGKMRIKMNNQDQTQSETSRRDFLKKSIIAGAIATPSSLENSFYRDDVELTGEKVSLMSPEGELITIDKAYLKPVPSISLDESKKREGIPDRKFVMVIDLAQCKNLRKCHDACEKMHYLSPEKEWLKVLKQQDNDLTSPYWQPTMCFHCDEPPCVKVCPVDATYKRTDGIVLVDNEQCIGCRFCMVACPYSARSFDWSEPDIPESIAEMVYDPETSCPPKKGTVSKCDFCPDVVRKGEMPHCVTACPNGVFYFGDENEDAVSNGTETVRLSELLRDRSGYRFMEELGTKPRVYYLPPVNRSFPFEDDEFSGNAKS